VQLDQTTGRSGGAVEDDRVERGYSSRLKTTPGSSPTTPGGSQQVLEGAKPVAGQAAQ